MEEFIRGLTGATLIIVSIPIIINIILFFAIISIDKNTRITTDLLEEQLHETKKLNNNIEKLLILKARNDEYLHV